MRLLLDECVPWPMRKILSGHQCASVRDRGWTGIKNGTLLRLAEPEFDAFITSDQSIQFQQNVSGYRIAILQLSTNNLRRILAAAAEIQAALTVLQPGEVRVLAIP
jgi:hypothetical protein